MPLPSLHAICYTLIKRQLGISVTNSVDCCFSQHLVSRLGKCFPFVRSTNKFVMPTPKATDLDFLVTQNSNFCAPTSRWNVPDPCGSPRWLFPFQRCRPDRLLAALSQLTGQTYTDRNVGGFYPRREYNEIPPKLLSVALHTVLVLDLNAHHLSTIEETIQNTGSHSSYRPLYQYCYLMIF